GSVTQPAQSGTGTGRPIPAGTPGAGNEIARALGNEQNPDAQSEKWPARLARIGLSLAMAALLGAILAFRPRKNEAVSRPPEAARTQILIALLASALVLVAAGGIVFAPAIVGAAILIRIRPAAFDSREGAGILISAGIGLACGAGRWEVALILCGFAFAVLWVLDSSPHEDLVRSIDLSVETRSVKETNEV